MRLSISLLLLFFFFMATISFAQSEKDLILNEQILPLYALGDQEDYYRAKHLLLELEEKAGYLPQETYHLLDASFQYDDLLFFKANLIRLTEEFGFDLSLLSKNASYYTAITSGSLSGWFKSVYPESREKWLAGNYWKIPYLKELNDLYIKDQYVARNFSMLLRKAEDENETKLVEQLFWEEYKANFEELLWICEKIGSYPTAKTFALIQTPFHLVEHHLLKIPEYSMKYLRKIHPYWEKSYLAGNMDYTHFKNFDIQLFLATGKQYFGLLDPKKMPKEILEIKKMDRNDTIPVLDAGNLGKRRKRLGWD